MSSIRWAPAAGRHRARAGELRSRLVPALMASLLVGGIVLVPGAAAPVSAAPAAASGGVVVPVTDTRDGGTVCDARPMTIPAVGSAAPWGAAIEVPALTGRISAMSVQLRGLDVRAVQDLDILLVGPDGARRATVLSDAGPAQRALSGSLDLTFQDDALLAAPTGLLAGLMLSGTYRPTDDSAAGPDAYPAPVAPISASAAAPADLGVFEGSSTAGTWTLYVVDDEVGDPALPASSQPGSLAGWCLTFHQVAPTVTELAGPAVIIASQKAGYRATVRSDGVRATGGTVTFKDGSKVLGRASVGDDGIATLTTSEVGVGTRAITASYDGTGIWQDSTSAALTTKVLPASTDLVLSATTIGSAAHPRVRLKAKVSARAPATAAVGDGTVEFSRDGRKIGSGSVSATGELSAEVDATGVPGTVTYRADYRGSAAFAASSASAEAEVPKVPTKVRGEVTTDDPTFGSPVTVSVKIFEDRNGQAPVTAGTARLLVDGVSVGVSDTPDRTGRVTLTVDSVSAGSRRLTVEFLGTDTWAPSSGSGTVQVDRADSSTVVRSAPTPSTFGSPVTLTATVAAGSQGVSSGSVTFTDGATTLGTTGVRDGRATLTLGRPSPGAHRFSASFSGTDDVRGSAGSADHQVQQAPSASMVSLDADRIRPDRSAAATVRVSSPAGDVLDGTVTLRVDGQPVLPPQPVGQGGRTDLRVPPLSVGAHRIQVDYSGSTAFTPSTGATDLTVEPIAVVVGVEIVPSALVVGRSATFRASVREPDGTPVSAGRIEFSLDGAVAATADLDGAGNAAFSQRLLSAHRMQLRARYLPDGDHAPAQAQMLADIGKAVAGIRIVAPAARLVYPDVVSVTATVTAPGVPVTGGSVTLSSDGVQLGAPVAVDASGRAVIRLPILSAGRHVITAAFSGTDDVGTVSARWQHSVERAGTMVSARLSPGARIQDGSPVAVQATVLRAGSTQPAAGRAQLLIDGRPAGPAIGIGTDGRVLLEPGALPIGSHRVVVAYLPDGNHRPSSGGATVVSVVPQLVSGGPYRVAEGAALRLVAGQRSGGASITWDINGDGVPDARGADVAVDWDRLTELGVDDGPSTHEVTAVATRNGQSTSVTAQIEVSNAAPRADVALLQAATAGDPVTIEIDSADSSPVDDASNLTVRIRWDEGGPWSDASGVIVGPQSGRWTHTYRVAGIHEPLVEITDKDGGVTRVSAGRVTVQEAPSTPALRPEMAQPPTAAVPSPAAESDPDQAGTAPPADQTGTGRAGTQRPGRAASGAAGSARPVPGGSGAGATGRGATDREADQPRRVATVTALAVPLPAVAVPLDERAAQTRPGTSRTTSADGVSADVALAGDNSGPARAPMSAGVVAVLLLLAAGLVGWVVRRRRLG